ncbi:TrkA-N domain-containing protein [Candidatus Magnetoovum chiemensis]|nr:TrkA-N domain-containing protein [Candidatus Magnetoovum chiemensis]
MALTLSNGDCDVIALDKDPAKVKELADHVSFAAVLDASDGRALKEAGVESVDAAVVSIGENVEANILAVMNLKELGVKYIVARATSELHGKVLTNLGVNRVVFPMRDMGKRVVGSLIKPKILELIELTDEYRIAEIPAPKITLGKTLKDANLRGLYRVSIIAIKRSGFGKEGWNINPLPDDKIEKDDSLVVLGTIKDIERLS